MTAPAEIEKLAEGLDSIREYQAAATLREMSAEVERKDKLLEAYEAEHQAVLHDECSATYCASAGGGMLYNEMMNVERVKTELEAGR